MASQRISMLLLLVLALIFGMSTVGVHPVATTTGAIHFDQEDEQTLSVTLEPFISNLSSPVFLTHSRDGSGRLFCVEQPGRIRIVQNNTLLATPFLDISAKVLFGGERGLLGLTFHPDFKTNRRFFVDYTRQTDGATVISEFTASEANPNLASSTERVLLTIAQPFANHNGGWIDFGPDGFLYIGMGDGGSAGDPQNNAQNLESLLGKMLRIDVDRGSPYGIPADNPFAGSLPGRDEIYAYGLRNPWRCAFDRKTNELYAADVGQNKLEEVDLITKGGNYGWRLMEGSQCFNPATNCSQTGLIPPILEYGRSEGCSITGGYVYRGKSYPALDGLYLYGDYCQGTIWGFAAGKNTVLARSGLRITSFGEDETGELYVVAANGTVSRLVGPAAQQGCVLTCPANITVTDADGDGFETVSFPEPGKEGPCGQIEAEPASGTRFPVGTTTVTWRSRSVVGNATCTFTVRVNPGAGGSDTTPPVVTVLSPNGGEVLIVGSEATIKWTSSDNVAVTRQNVLVVSEFTDIAPLVVASGLNGSAQSFTWKVTGFPSPARVQVQAQDAVGNMGSDVSNSTFGIATPDTIAPTVRVLTPNGGEKVRAGNILTVTWQSADNIGVVSQTVALSADGGVTFPNILATGLLGNIQTLAYSIPDTQGKVKTARIRVTAQDTAGNQGSDTSDANFVIKKKKPQ
ncbi:MAG: PQQ-dependent sugar dehydrogenase [Blastocatellia bacterium]|nr:PQQ-dependent sugar dehydrogenase [Blastocatellia bacterium]